MENLTLENIIDILIKAGATKSADKLGVISDEELEKIIYEVNNSEYDNIVSFIILKLNEIGYFPNLE